MDFDSDGVRIHYEVNGHERGTPVVMVHGFASDYRLNWVGSRWQETFDPETRRHLDQLIEPTRRKLGYC